MLVGIPRLGERQTARQTDRISPTIIDVKNVVESPVYHLDDAQESVIAPSLNNALFKNSAGYRDAVDADADANVAKDAPLTRAKKSLSDFSVPSDAVEIHDSPRVDPAEQVVYAGIWRRTAAFLVDYIVLFGLMFLVVVVSESLVFMPQHDERHIMPFIFQVSILTVGWLYFALLESSCQQATIGKLVMGLRVTDANGNRIGFKRASVRHFGKLLTIATLGLGYLWLVLRRKKQTLHDSVSGSCVENVRF